MNLFSNDQQIFDNNDINLVVFIDIIEYKGPAKSHQKAAYQ